MCFIIGFSSQADVSIVDWPHPEFIPKLAEDLGLEVDGQSISDSLYLSQKVDGFGKTQTKVKLFEKVKSHVAKNIAKVSQLCA